MDLAALTARLNDLAGFDLSSAEACSLLNEARAEAARRSRYPRKVADIGPTVAGQVAYNWPEDLLIPLSVSVAGEPWEASDRETVRQYEKGELVLQSVGVWYEASDESGARKLYLYPAPSGGDTIEVEWVFQGSPFTADETSAEPDEFPSWWHSKLIFIVAETYYAFVEDDEELAQINREKADLAVGDLIRYDNERHSGSGVFRPGIVGVTA